MHLGMSLGPKTFDCAPELNVDMSDSSPATAHLCTHRALIYAAPRNLISTLPPLTLHVPPTQAKHLDNLAPALQRSLYEAELAGEWNSGVGTGGGGGGGGRRVIGDCTGGEFEVRCQPWSLEA